MGFVRSSPLTGMNRQSQIGTAKEHGETLSVFDRGELLRIYGSSKGSSREDIPNLFMRRCSKDISERIHQIGGHR